MMFKVRHNVMNVTSMSAFVQIKGGMNNGCKDVLFVRALGATKDTIKNIEQIDNVLGADSCKGKSFYNRVTSLAKMMMPEDVAYYTEKYNEWISSGKRKLTIKSDSARNELFQYALSEACNKIENLYAKCEKNSTDSMKKNFIVKCLFWYDSIFHGDKYIWNEKMNSKVVAVNVVKVQEYLFWYMVSLCGNDVMLLQLSEDVRLEPQFKMLSASFQVGDFSEFTIPSYDASKIRAYANENKVDRVEEKAKERPNIQVTLPRRVTETAVNKNTASRTATSTSTASRITTNKPTTSPVEKTYEELAQMASSVVMIAVHDRLGKVIGTGSGIMIGRNGYILTNNHVASGGQYYSVKIEDDDNVYNTDQVIKYNPLLDLAIIRIDRQLSPLSIYKGQDNLVRGQKVVAIGSPLGLFNSVSDGIISGFRVINSVDMIQFTAPISHGSSGGAVLNMYGEVIGISTAGFDSGQNINLAMGYECINMFIKGFTG